MNIRFMRDLSREDVVAAFKASDVFLLTSRKEIAPIVILECAAAKIPFISMPVGNIFGEQGGMSVWFRGRDEKGYVIFNEGIINRYANYTYECLTDVDLRNRIISYGQGGIEEIEWKNIVPLYHEVFNG